MTFHSQMQRHTIICRDIKKQYLVHLTFSHHRMTSKTFLSLKCINNVTHIIETALLIDIGTNIFFQIPIKNDA